MVGAGGHGREIVGILRRAGEPVDGIVADTVDDHTAVDRIGVDVLGPLDWLADRTRRVAVAIGSIAGRQKVVGRLAEIAPGLRFPPVVDPGALMADDVVLADGVVLFPRTVVSTNVTLGPHVHLNTASVVSHDGRLGAFTTLSPGCLLNGAVTAGTAVFFGTGSIVIPGCGLGDGAIVAAGSVVIGDVAAGATVVGVPAAPTRANTSITG